jgi:hypothetical protein
MTLQFSFSEGCSLVELKLLSTSTSKNLKQVFKRRTTYPDLSADSKGGRSYEE